MDAKTIKRIQSEISQGNFEVFFNVPSEEEQYQLSTVLFGESLVNGLPKQNGIDFKNLKLSIQRIILAILAKGEVGFKKEVAWQRERKNVNTIRRSSTSSSSSSSNTGGWGGKWMSSVTSMVTSTTTQEKTSKIEDFRVDLTSDDWDVDDDTAGFAHLESSSIYSMTMQYISSSGNWPFAKLSFCGCSVLTKDILIQIIGKCPNVTILDIRHCPLMDAEIVQTLRFEYPNILLIKSDFNKVYRGHSNTGDEKNVDNLPDSSRVTTVSTWVYRRLTNKDELEYIRRRWEYPQQVLLGSSSHGVTLVDAQSILTIPEDYFRRIADPILLNTTIFASTSTTRDHDQIYGTMWTDYRTDRRLGYDIQTVIEIYRKDPDEFHEKGSYIENPNYGIHGTTGVGDLPCLRVLDATLGQIVKDDYGRTCGWILSVTDGSDHPMDDQEQIQIARVAAMVCEQMAASLSSRMLGMHSSKGIRQEATPMEFTQSSMASIMSDVGDKVLDEISKDQVIDYVGAGNVTVCIRPSSLCPNTSNPNSFVIDTSSVGDCFAIVYHPNRLNENGRYVDILAMPKLFLTHTNTVTGNKDYQPYSITRISKHDESSFNNPDITGSSNMWMVDYHHYDSCQYGDMIFLMTDGCWEQFSQQWIEINKDELKEGEHPYMKPDLDIIAIETCLQQCHDTSESGNNTIKRCIKSYVKALRDEILKLSELNRQELSKQLHICREYRDSEDFQEELYVQKDNDTGRFSFVSWNDCRLHHKHNIPDNVIEAVEYIIKYEKFNDNIPFITILDHKPSLGDDCTILGFALPSRVGEDIVEDVIELRVNAPKYERKDCYEKILTQPYTNKLECGRQLSTELESDSIDKNMLLLNHVDDLLQYVGNKTIKLNKHDKSVKNNFIIHRGDDDDEDCGEEVLKYPSEWIVRAKEAANHVLVTPEPKNTGTKGEN